MGANPTNPIAPWYFTRMTKIVIIGANGNVGIAVMKLFKDNYPPGIKICPVDPSKPFWDLPDEAIRGQGTVINCAPFFEAPKIAKLASERGFNYFDIIADRKANDEVISIMSDNPNIYFMVGCGLAPGFVNIVGAELVRRFEVGECNELQIKVGALPKHTTSDSKYLLTWSPDGLVNEYRNSCEEVVGYEVEEVRSLEYLCEIVIRGLKFESFNTSGGIGDTLDFCRNREVGCANYQSIRYPGHLSWLKQQRDLNILKELPFTKEDMVVVYASAVGRRNGRLEEENWVQIVDHNLGMTNLQATTAAGVVGMWELAYKMGKKGRIYHHDVGLDDFLNTCVGDKFRGSNRGVRE